MESVRRWYWLARLINEGVRRWYWGIHLLQRLRVPPGFPCILSFAAFDTSETKCCMLSTTVVNSDSSFGFEACWLD